MLTFHLVSLFPDFFTSPLACGLMARARANRLVDYSLHDPRDYAANRHRHVDDRPYGGGPGMVIQAEPVAKALGNIAAPGRMLLMTPCGRPFTEEFARELVREENITLICGRYEGLDARLAALFPLEPVSVGDAVFNGGEVAALGVMEAVARLLPGFMGKTASGEEESFSEGLLEYPHYTRPEIFRGMPVPETLLSGDHGRIAAWRRNQALSATLALRPELLARAPLDERDARHIASLPRERVGRNLSFCLLHHPVVADGKKNGTSSLTNLDIHDIARVSMSYGMGPFYAVTPLADQMRVLEAILRHWSDGPGGRAHPDRSQAISLVRPASSLEEAVELATAHAGVSPRLVGSSARWPGGRHAPPALTPDNVRRWLCEGPVLLCLGTAQGLSDTVLDACDGQLRPLRFLGYNHLSVRSAAAILADRILGDFD